MGDLWGLYALNLLIEILIAFAVFYIGMIVIAGIIKSVYESIRESAHTIQFNHARRTRRQPPIQITDSDLVDKIASIEGDRWRDRQNVDREWAAKYPDCRHWLNHNVHGALLAWGNRSHGKYQAGKDYFRYVIHGADHGLHHNCYVVCTDGHVAFSRHSCWSADTISKARAAGFDLECFTEYELTSWPWGGYVYGPIAPYTAPLTSTREGRWK